MVTAIYTTIGDEQAGMGTFNRLQLVKIKSYR